MCTVKHFINQSIKSKCKSYNGTLCQWHQTQKPTPAGYHFGNFSFKVSGLLLNCPNRSSGVGWQSGRVPDHSIWRWSGNGAHYSNEQAWGMQLLEPGFRSDRNYTCLNFSSISMSITYKNNSMKIGLLNYCRSMDICLQFDSKPYYESPDKKMHHSGVC